MPTRSTTSLDALSNAQLQAELSRRQFKLAGLERRHRALSRRLAAVEAKIRAAGGEIGGARAGRRGGRGGRRPHGDSLGAHLLKVLKGRTLGVAEAIAAVKKAGYPTSAKSFTTMVHAALRRTKGIRRVARGKYAA